jgi:hypothetical protein
MARIDSARPQVAAQPQQKAQAKLNASVAKELKPALREIKQPSHASKGTRVDVRA